MGRIENDRIVECVYIGKYASSCSIGWLQKWIYTVRDHLKKKRFGCPASKENSVWWEWIAAVCEGNPYGIAQGKNPWLWRDATVVGLWFYEATKSSMDSGLGVCTIYYFILFICAILHSQSEHQPTWQLFKNIPITCFFLRYLFVIQGLFILQINN